MIIIFTGYMFKERLFLKISKILIIMSYILHKSNQFLILVVARANYDCFINGYKMLIKKQSYSMQKMTFKSLAIADTTNNRYLLTAKI